MTTEVPVIDLGRMPYPKALDVQRSHVKEVFAARDAGQPESGRILVVEHDPVITVSRRPGAMGNLLIEPAALAGFGIALEDTDRGGDITYHGPGQLVVYPILDLNRLNLGLHAYMRLLEQGVIDACAHWGVAAERDLAATGVWVRRDGRVAKIAAMGVRVQRWVSMHGLALNIAPDMTHFQFIVPCGLAGRPVTSLAQELRGPDRRVPSMAEAASILTDGLRGAIRAAAIGADRARDSASSTEGNAMGIPQRSGPRSS